MVEEGSEDETMKIYDIERERGRERERETDRQTDRQRERERERELKKCAEEGSEN